MYTFTLAFISTLSLSVHAASISDPVSHTVTREQHNRQFHNADYVSESFEPTAKIHHRQVNAPLAAPVASVPVVGVHPPIVGAQPHPPVLIPHAPVDTKVRVKLNAMFKKPKTVARGPAFAGLSFAGPAFAGPPFAVPGLPVPGLVPALPVPALPVPALPVPALPVPKVPAVPGHSVPILTKAKIGGGAKLKIKDDIHRSEKENTHQSEKDNTHQSEKDNTHQSEQHVNRLTNNAALDTANIPAQSQVDAPVQDAVSPVAQRPVAVPPAEDEPVEKSSLDSLLADLDLSLFSLSGNTKNEGAHQSTHEDTIKRQLPAPALPTLPLITGTNPAAGLPTREDSMDFSDDQIKDVDLSEYEAGEFEDFEERF